jgi:large subunit ribosomal protein L20
MARVKRGVMHVKRRRGIMQKAKGFEAGRKNLIKLAKVAITKAGAYAYKDRKIKKRLNRANWQVRINAALQPLGFSYSKFMGALKKEKIDLNRKMLAEIAAEYPEVFKKIVETSKV